MTEAAFLPLFDQYHNMVYRLALTSLRSAHDAEDMVQTVFLKLLSSPSPPAPGKEKAWLAQVTVNGCRDLAAAAAAALILSLGTAGATGALQSVKDVFACLFGSSPDQTRILEEMSRSVGASATADGLPDLSYGSLEFYDADPSDPSIQFMEKQSYPQGVPKGVTTRTFENLSYGSIWSDDADLVAAGPWELTFPLDAMESLTIGELTIPVKP